MARKPRNGSAANMAKAWWGESAPITWGMSAMLTTPSTAIVAK
jgi:hypothetical protein